MPERFLHAASLDRPPLIMNKTFFYNAAVPLALTMAVSILPATGDVLNFTDYTVTKDSTDYLENTVTVGGTEYHAGIINGAIFRRVNDDEPDNSGSGVFQDLYTNTAKSGDNGIEEGYNRKKIMNSSVGGADPYLTVGQLGTDVTGNYAVFGIDTNEQGVVGQVDLSLDKFKVYVGSNTDPDPLPGDEASLGSLGSKIYDMDDADLNGVVDVDNTVLLSYDSGSGAFETYIFVPMSAFAGLANDSNVYVYTQFGAFGVATADGDERNFGAASGGENIAALTDDNFETRVVIIPEPSSALLASFGAMLLAFRRRRA